MANFATRLWRKITGGRGSGGGFARPMVLEVAGSTEQTSIIPVEHEGGRYLVADRADAIWVERIRLSGRGSLINKDRKMAVTATEVSVEDRAAIITAYRARAGEAADATAWAESADPADHPVFKLDRASDGDRGGGSAW
ncbi:MAG: hypothetical protein ABWY62_00775 [Acidimicrobiia bacterium]